VKRLLIIGGRGFVGRHCLSPALVAGFEVHATASGSAVPHDLADLDVTWHVGDLLKPDAGSALIEHVRPQYVLHTAWETTHGSYWSSPANLTWLEFGIGLAAAFAKSGGVRLVSAGTCAEYDWDHGFMVEGITPENPATYYGHIKLAYHNILVASAAQLGFSAATGRIFFAYGPFENPARLVPYACRQLASGQEARFSSGNFHRDFMHVSDIGTGLVALLTSSIEGACNICSGTPTLLGDIAMRLGHISGRPDLIRLAALPDRPRDPPMIVGDNRRLRATGWQPTIQLSDGLEMAFRWWEANGNGSATGVST
jgi:nucleoside-diphosphate-sugar epimerase